MQGVVSAMLEVRQSTIRDLNGAIKFGSLLPARTPRETSSSLVTGKDLKRCRFMQSVLCLLDTSGLAIADLSTIQRLFYDHTNLQS